MAVREGLASLVAVLVSGEDEYEGELRVTTRKAKMSDTTVTESKPRAGRAARRFGYAVAIGVNAILLYVVNQLLEWEWPSFLTEEFDRVVGIMSFSIIVSIVANVLYLMFDPRWFKSLGQIVENVVGFAVGIRVWQVFPFDFSSWSMDWSWLIRVALIVGLVGLAIGTIVEVAKLARWSATYSNP
jgi:hypothetical protein